MLTNVILSSGNHHTTLYPDVQNTTTPLHSVVITYVLDDIFFCQVTYFEWVRKKKIESFQLRIQG